MYFTAAKWRDPPLLISHNRPSQQYRVKYSDRQCCGKIQISLCSRFVLSFAVHRPRMPCPKPLTVEVADAIT
jgi:hypothetical protein